MEKGFSVVFIIVLVTLALVSGVYFAYYQNFQNIRQIHSYDDCAKAGYPVLLSYPGQCNTPDGQHFVQELSEEAKKKLVPPSVDQLDGTANWKTYTNTKVGYTIKFPADKFIECNIEGDTTDFNLFNGVEGEDFCFAGEDFAFLRLRVNPEFIESIGKSPHPECYKVVEQDIQINDILATRYTNTILKDTNECNMASSYARNAVIEVFEHSGNSFVINYYSNQDTVLKDNILSTLTFLK